MKRIAVTAAMLCISIVVFGGENLFENGDFEKGRSRWSGDRDVESESKTNKICIVELDDNKVVSFYQKIVIRDPTELLLRFKIKKSDGYKGDEKIHLRFSGDKSLTVTERALPDNDEWNKIEVKYRNTSGNKRIKVHFEVTKGRGSLLFDDIEIVEKE